MSDQTPPKKAGAPSKKAAQRLDPSWPEIPRSRLGYFFSFLGFLFLSLAFSVLQALRRVIRSLRFLVSEILFAAVSVAFRSSEVAQWKHLLASIPALGMAITAAGLAFASRQLAPEDLEVTYIVAADQAAVRKEWAAAQTYYRRALALDGYKQVQIRYNLAVCHEALGQRGAAQVLLQPLTKDSGGYAPAHLLRARQLLAQKDVSPADRKEAIAQLQWATARQPELLEAQVLLGNQYLTTGRRTEAKEVLLRVAEKKPATYLIVAKICRDLNDPKEARNYAERARDNLLPRAKSDGDEAALVSCSEAYLLLEDYPAAVALLREGLVAKDRSTLRDALAGSYARWAAALARQNPADVGARLRVVEEGLRVMPGDGRLLTPLVELSNLTGAEGARARDRVEQILTEGKPSGILHLLLGLDAWKRGQQEAGRVHLEQAYRLTPDVALVSNNLAWMLAHGPRPDLERALALAETTIQRWPQQPNFRDTRGQILVKQGRYKDALEDLELAQRSLPSSKDRHAALAVAYGKLGMASIAERHRRQAEGKAGQ